MYTVVAQSFNVVVHLGTKSTPPSHHQVPVPIFRMRLQLCVLQRSAMAASAQRKSERAASSSECRCCVSGCNSGPCLHRSVQKIAATTRCPHLHLYRPTALQAIGMQMRCLTTLTLLRQFLLAIELLSHLTSARPSMLQPPHSCSLSSLSSPHRRCCVRSSPDRQGGH